MDPIPVEPDPFFTSYLPRRFAAIPGVEGLTSVGSLVVQVTGCGEWTLRVLGGALEVTRGMEDDVMLKLTVSAEDFAPLLAEISDGGSEGPELLRAGGLLRALSASPETARLVRHVPGSVAFVARDGEATRRLLVTPGRRAPGPSADCTIECSLDDLRLARARGESFMNLFVQGKLRITGNVQVALALSAVFS